MGAFLPADDFAGKLDDRLTDHAGAVWVDHEVEDFHVGIVFVISAALDFVPEVAVLIENRLGGAGWQDEKFAAGIGCLPDVGVAVEEHPLHDLLFEEERRGVAVWLDFETPGDIGEQSVWADALDLTTAAGLEGLQRHFGDVVADDVGAAVGGGDGFGVFGGDDLAAEGVDLHDVDEVIKGVDGILNAGRGP